MQIPDEIRLGVELLGLFTSAGVVLWRLGGISERFNQQGTRLDQVDGRFDKMEKSIEKIGEALQIVAIQREAIQSIRELVASNTKRTDETFSRVFTILDRLQSNHG